MAIMYMVQSPVDEKIYMIAMRNHFMAAVAVMVASTVHWRTEIRICLAHWNCTFIPMTFVFMV